MQTTNPQSGVSRAPIIIGLVIVGLGVLIGYFTFGSSPVHLSTARIRQNNARAIITRATYIMNYDVTSHLSPADQAAYLYTKGYITESFLSSIESQANVTNNPLTCGQSPSTSWLYGTPAIGSTNTTASLVMNAPNSSSGSAITSYWVNTDNGWDITALSCA